MIISLSMRTLNSNLILLILVLHLAVETLLNSFKFQSDSINTYIIFWYSGRPFSSLNSNLILLIPFLSCYFSSLSTSFKFQSDSINTFQCQFLKHCFMPFKFQSDSINTRSDVCRRTGYRTLNSNLILLILICR